MLVWLTTTSAVFSLVDISVNSYFEGASAFLCYVIITSVMYITTSTNKQENINGIVETMMKYFIFPLSGN